MVDNIEITVDTTDGMQKLSDLELARQRAASAINTTLGMARSAYGVMTGIVRMAGGSVSTIFSTIISAGISMVSILTPILTAQASTYDFVRAGIGLVNLGIASAAIAAAQAQQTDLANKLHSANAMMHSIQMLVGNMYTL